MVKLKALEGEQGEGTQFLKGTGRVYCGEDRAGGK